MKFSDLKDKILTEITVNDSKDRITFVDSDGGSYSLYHGQDCCESVYIEDICGNLEDLKNSPILMAEEVVEGRTPTWTFYKLATAKGYVTIRWIGDSNGYYSESVDFEVN